MAFAMRRKMMQRSGALEWHQRHPGSLESKQRSQAIRAGRMTAAGAIGTHTHEEWLALIAEFRGHCVKCGFAANKLTRDHIIPISKGGSDAITNLQPMCRGCNCGKGDDTVDWAAHRRAVGFAQ